MEDGGVKQSDIPISLSAQRVHCDPVVNLRNRGRGIGLPSPAKFGTGYLTPCGFGAVSRTIPVNDSESGSGSDMDLSSGSEDDINVGRYSVVPSPQDDKFQTQKRLNNGCDQNELKQWRCVERLEGNGDWKFVRRPGLTEDEFSDSATSTEVSFAQSEINNAGSFQRSTHTLDGCSSSVTWQVNQEREQPRNDTPSAPPFIGLGSERINPSFDHISSLSGVHVKPLYANSNDSVTTNGLRETTGIHSGTTVKDNIEVSNPSYRTAGGTNMASPVSLPAHLPAFRLLSEQGTWCALIAYDACVRLCLHAWSLKGSPEVHCFLENECALLRDAFGLRHVLLQSEDELLDKRSAELVSQGTAINSRKLFGKIKVQVRRVKIGLDQPSGCSLTSLQSLIKNDTLHARFSNVKSALHSAWEPMQQVRLSPHAPENGSFSVRSLAYARATTKYMKQISGLVKIGTTSLFSSSLSYEVVQDKASSWIASDYCSYQTVLSTMPVVGRDIFLLAEIEKFIQKDAVKMQPGIGEAHVFFPDNLGDYLIIEVQDSKAQHYGRAVVQVASIADNPGDKLRWWPIYGDPEHEPVGRIQLCLKYSTSPNENNQPKCGSITETMAYDFVLEVAMKVQQFQQRKLFLHGSWKWLVTEFASYYGVSDAYAKLRSLSYIMGVATPTEDCLNIVYDLLSDVLLKAKNKSMLSHQENRMLVDIEDQVKRVIALVFENYKSLDESLPSGVMDVFRPASELAAPALIPAIKLYILLHDILSPEAQLKFCRYFQAAAKKRLRRHLVETDDLTLSSNEGTMTDLPMSYEKMKSLILNIRNEIFTDMKIHNQQVLPSFIELPNLSSSIYSVELCNRLREFLVACPPPGPTTPVAQLVITAADFQRDLAMWNINPIKGGVNAKELFNSYISQWIQDKRRDLLELCKLDKVKWSGVRTQHSTSPFIDDMYDHLKETLNQYKVILCCWPEYISVLEHAIADVQKATVEAMDKLYSDVLLPLKDNLANKLFGHKYIQKLSKGTVNTYLVPNEVARCAVAKDRKPVEVLEFLHPDDGQAVIGEHLNDVTVMLRAKFRNYRQAIVEKLTENTRVHSATRLKNIIRDSKEVESDVHNRMLPLKDILVQTIDQLHTIVEPPVFIEICREFWDRMGQDILHVLEDRREKRTWYKGLRVAVSIIDDIFASEMQKLLGNSLQEKDLEPPASMKEVHSMF
ncbi:hypothetical protein FNV43_RR17494 [Rhamnella rubrinervis]|uniref:Uncharacterized protein n=1 Tax=Rhamnella rubrinervis TaxID=2594499 RepID=A0A8K0E4A6_9ROSA|nr:hypothetical protein FNV43_RR17494 [Rhamnella rubrinervis]